MERQAFRAQPITDPRLILRLGSFLSILAGVLLLLALVLPQAWSTAAAPILTASPEEALGLVFMGFAVRLSRLEQYNVSVRRVLRASRLCLLAVGVFGMQGAGMMNWLGGPAGTLPQPSFAASLCFVMVSGILMLGRVAAWKKKATYLLHACVTYVAASGISMFLEATGLVPSVWFFEIGTLPLILISVVCLGLAVWNRMPGLLDLLSAAGPTAEAARQTFPLAICLPVVLAFLRHRAEMKGYLHPSFGLLLHVLLSTVAMAAIVGWNIFRLGMANRVRESSELAAHEKEKQYWELLGSLEEAVWIFDRNGDVLFSNSRAERYGVGASGNMIDVLGKSQHNAVVSSAIFGKPKSSVMVRDWESGQEQSRQVRYLRILNSSHVPEGSVVLVLASAPAEVPAVTLGLTQLANKVELEASMSASVAHNPGVA